MSLAADSRPFDVCGPLPTGVTVLEASAGTGKTYTIAALAARYVADGMPLRDLLLVTFTRMATGELRERVRERLVGVERALAGGPASDRDDVVALLADAPPDAVRARRERLGRALADFDAATITTTHGFCQEVLGGLGIAGDVERDCAFVEDVADVVGEVVDDLYVRRFHRGEPPRFTREEAMRIASIAVANPGAPIEPADAAPDTVPAMRRRLALAIRDELERRKQRAAVMTYDDLLMRLDATLAGPGGAAVAARLRARYRVVLVDEFQDTDPVQWDIMRRAFGDGTLVLIGDPKQAIYAFRGADVYAYLEAALAAAGHATLQVNWRSDQGLVDAYDALFGGARLGHEGIVYRDVRAADANRAPRLSGAPVAAPLRVRIVHRDEPSISRTQGGYVRNASAREHIASDLAADVVGLLSSGAEIERRADDGTTLAREPIRPGHVAVLVRTHRNAALIRAELDAAGIPAVINGAGSVFGTAPARAWLRLLEAIERPTSSARARSAALTPFLGWSAERVACADERAWEEVHRRLHDWARVLRVKGVASLTEAVTVSERLPARVLAAVDGERTLTDLRHVGQLLHAAATTAQLGTTALTSWLRRRIAEAEQDTGDEERSRRLESDAEAVQVLTIHRSKGLEFPIVYYPYLWEPGFVAQGVPVAYHDPEAGDVRTIDVGLEGPGFDRHRRQHLVEQRGEDLRLAYVALTRARHQAVVWWAGSWNSRDSALGRLLFARDEQGNVAPAGKSTPADAAVVARLEALAAAAPGCIGVERSVLGLPVAWSGPPRAPGELVAAAFDRQLDRRWRRTSYSDLTAGAHEVRVASEPEEVVVTDEPAPVTLPGPRPAGDGAALRATPSLLGAMPVGLHVGTFVHRVLEATDFAAPDLAAELARHVAATQARRHVDIGDPAEAVAGLRAAIETPLGPLLAGVRLRDVRRTDRLDELDFELPLVGGDAPTGRLALAAIAAVLREHLPPGDPLAGYAERLRDPALRPSVRGYLTGSIDLVVRAGEAFAIVDYKTNRLAAPGEELSAWHHRPVALAAEMDRAHYGLQALLYTVALHRYLRWRLAGYDPERNLAGVLYLFVRGMTGAATPTVDGVPCGVFAWRPARALVEALSDALDGARPA
ncbi:MAG: UvrD-helicase domain-containing protein [Solirubrobacteraceae bacterium]